MMSFIFYNFTYTCIYRLAFLELQKKKKKKKKNDW